MGIAPVKTEIAILAKAPLPGYCKTRLIPRLGAQGAADLQARFILRAVETAAGAAIGPITLWCAPDASHPLFARVARESGLHLAVQPEGDLGERMSAAFRAAAHPLVLIGTDCPCLEPRDIVDAASALARGADIALVPVEDGGYSLIAARQHHPGLFRDMPWSTPDVCELTLARAAAAGSSVELLRTLWDIDRPDDLFRLEGLEPPLPPL